MTDVMALHDTLDASVEALVAAEAGNRARAQLMLTEASLAAVSVFPAGTAGAAALADLLGIITEAAAAVEAA